jgi:predicted  nucleic acid-binding Zn-ribbon protein
MSSDRHTSLTEQLKGIRMAIDESKRQDLYLVATEKFGRKEADTLMTLLPTSVWEDVATKTDLELHSALLKIQFNEVHNDLRTEISGVRTELKGDIADLKDSLASLRGELKGDVASLRGEIASLRGELKGDIADLRAELKGDIADLRAENASLRAELKGDIADLRTELKGDIADLRTELKGDIADLRAELKGDIADVRLEIAELRTEMHQMFRKNYMVMISAIFTINSLFFAATKFWG